MYGAVRKSCRKKNRGSNSSPGPVELEAIIQKICVRCKKKKKKAKSMKPHLQSQENNDGFSLLNQYKG